MNLGYLICENEFHRGYTKDKRAEKRGKATLFFLVSVYYSCYECYFSCYEQKNLKIVSFFRVFFSLPTSGHVEPVVDVDHPDARVARVLERGQRAVGQKRHPLRGVAVGRRDVDVRRGAARRLVEPQADSPGF